MIYLCETLIRYKENNYCGKTSHAFSTGEQKHFALAFCDRTPTVDTTIYNHCMNEICVVNIPYPVE